MNKPLISIIVPIYKAEKYLRKCVDSILMQTYTNLEILLVDDGSPDNCGNICDAYALADERIKVIHKENGGVSAARNCGLESISGEYFMFVDADDWLEPNACKISLKKAIDIKADIIAFNLYRVNDKNKRVEHTYEERILNNRQDFDKIQKIIISSSYGVLNLDCGLAALPFFGPFCKLCRTDTFADRRFPVGMKRAEDNCYNLELLEKSVKIAIINEPLYNYYNNPASAENNFTDYIKLFEDAYGYFKKFIIEKKKDKSFWDAYHVGLCTNMVTISLLHLKKCRTFSEYKKQKANLKNWFVDKKLSKSKKKYFPYIMKYKIIFLLIKQNIYFPLWVLYKLKVR